MNRCNGVRGMVCAALMMLASAAHGQLVVINQFSTSSAVGLGFDHSTGDVWMYPDSGSVLRHYSPAGVLLGTVPRPGESADDADVEFTAGPLTLAGVPLPDATLLFINGESGVAEIYAIDKATGSVLATLVTSFGTSHVVGGCHHPTRGTIFMVQDAVPSGTTNDNLVAEIDPASGAVLQMWKTTTGAPGFTIDYADIDVAGNGNLVVVSADESSIAEFTPEGSLVELRALPAGVSSLSGIGVDVRSCEWWVIETNGQVGRLGGLSGSAVCGCVVDLNGDGQVDFADYLEFLNLYDAQDLRVDFNHDGFVDFTDYLEFLNLFDAGC